MGERATREDSCAKHGRGKADARRPMEALIEKLPPNQGGSGRHACAYCAYEHGYRQAERDIMARVRELLAMGTFD